MTPLPVHFNLLRAQDKSVFTYRPIIFSRIYYFTSFYDIDVANLTSSTDLDDQMETTKYLCLNDKEIGQTSLFL